MLQELVSQLVDLLKSPEVSFLSPSAQSAAGQDSPPCCPSLQANKSEIEKMVAAAGRTFSVVDGYKFPGEALGYSTKPSSGNTLD